MVAPTHPLPMPLDMERGLAPLFERARQQGLWFWCHYQDLWFSPEELKAHHRNEKFRWGAENWQLRDPAEHLATLKTRVVSAQQAADTFERRMASARYGSALQAQT